MTMFDDWKEAHAAAQTMANDCQHDVAIRKIRPFGKIQYRVGFASENDNNYALDEIVKPSGVLGTCDYQGKSHKQGQGGHYGNLCINWRPLA
jgi:hypothetical protein